MKAILGEFMRIQILQNGILREIASIENVQNFWATSIDLGAHSRDCHNRYWDSSIAVEEQKKTVSALAQLHLKYKQNQEQLKGLHKQLFAEVC